MTETIKPSLQMKRYFEASPQRVFDAWTKSDALKQWMGPGKVQVGDISVDLKEGGNYSLQMIVSDGDKHTVKGSYLEIDEPNKLVMTWQWNFEESVESRLTLEFNAHNSGTNFVLTHELLKDEESVANHTHGWEGSLLKLEGFLSA